MNRYLVCSLLVASPALAQSPPPADVEGVEADDTVEEEATEEPAQEVDLDAKTAALEAKLGELEAELRSSEAARKSRFPIKLGGHGDLGFFATQGDGSGIRRDVAHTMFPEYQDVGWVFYGDLLATQVNSRGDVADLGELPGVERADPLNSEGTDVLVNELNMTLTAGPARRRVLVERNSRRAPATVRVR